MYNKSLPITNFDEWVNFLRDWEKLGFAIPIEIDVKLTYYKYPILITSEGVFVKIGDEWKASIEKKLKDIYIRIPYFDLIIDCGDGEGLEIYYWMEQLVIERIKE